MHNLLEIVGDPVGGIRRHVHQIIDGLDKTKFNIWYAFSTVAQDAAFRRDLERLRAAKTVNLFPLRIIKKVGARDLWNIMALWRLAVDKDVAIIHGHGAKGGAYARIVGRLCGRNVIYSPHGGSVHAMFGRIPRMVYGWVERMLYSDRDYYLFESDYCLQRYQAMVGHAPARYCRNYHGINTARLDVVNDNRGADVRKVAGGFDVGVFGVLRWQKGQAVAIKAVGEMAANGGELNVRLHLFGEGPGRAELEGEVRRRGLEGRVIFYGDREAVEAHIKSMDLVVIPSFFESFGYVAVEAMALRKPVIASRVGGLMEIVEDNVTGLLVTPGDAAVLSAAIGKLAADRARCGKMGAAGFKRACLIFREDRMMQKIAEVYEKMVA